MILMTSVSRINDLFGEENLVRRQRHDARFINICMMVTLYGAAVSDALADGRVVSGVGGQYNFVAMAHELERARSILLLRSTRESGGRVESNVVFNYGHATIPRHLRDIVVTEYGIADLRGEPMPKSPPRWSGSRTRASRTACCAGEGRGQTAATMVHSPETRGNTPEALAQKLAPIGKCGLLPEFPLGTDFDPDELRLIPALRWLKRHSTGWQRLELAQALLGSESTADESAALARMGLSAPRGVKERCCSGWWPWACAAAGRLSARPPRRPREACGASRRSARRRRRQVSPRRKTSSTWFSSTYFFQLRVRARRAKKSCQ
jgi:hypothetical protein